MSGFFYEKQAMVSAEALMEVITDFSSYPSFLSSLQSINILRTTEQMWEVEFSVSLIRKFHYTLHLEKRNQWELHWYSLTGFFQKNEGFWKLIPNQEGVLIQYSIDMQMDTFLPASIKNSLSRNRLPQMIDAFIAEASSRQMIPGIDLGDN